MNIDCNVINTQPIYDAARKHFPTGQLDINSRTLFCSRTGETSYYVEVKCGKFILENEISGTKSRAFDSVLKKLQSSNYVRPMY